MGYQFMLLKASHEKLVRARRRAEKFGPKSDLFSQLVPGQQQTRFRCQMKGGAQAPSKGDPLMIYITSDGAKVYKQVREVGGIQAAVLPDLLGCFAGAETPEIHLAEAASDLDPFDSSFDIILRPPW